METPKLYTVPWSTHCKKVEDLLRDSKITFEKITLNWESLAAAPRDLGIRRLPAFDYGEKIYEGIYEIKSVIENNR